MFPKRLGFVRRNAWTKYDSDWVGTCSDPKHVNERLARPINDLLKEIQFSYDGEDDQIQEYYSEQHHQLGPTDLKLGSLPWKFTGHSYSLRCYHLDMASIINVTSRIPKVITLISDDPYDFFVNSPNVWKKIEPATYFTASEDDNQPPGQSAYFVLDVTIDRIHLQDYAGKPCNHDVNYNFDRCISEEVDK